MKTRTLLIASAVLLLLLGAWLFVDKPGKKTIYTESGKEAGGPMFPDFKAADATRIELSKEGTKVELVKRGGAWAVASAGDDAADKTQVDELLEIPSKLTFDNLKSKNKEKHDRFEVSDLKAARARYLNAAGSTLAEFLVGKPSQADYTLSYLRKPGQEKVYAAAGLQRFMFARDASSWRDRSIMEFDKAKAKAMRWTYPDGTETALEKNPAGSWALTVPESRPVAPEEADEILTLASSLKAVLFEDDPAAPTGFATETVLFQVEVEGESPRSVRFGHLKTSFQSYAKKDGRDAVFVMSKASRDGLVKRAADFAPYAPPGPDAGAPGADMEGLGLESAPSVSFQSSATEPASLQSEPEPLERTQPHGADIQ